MSKSPGMPSYGDLTALVAEQAARLVEYERRFVEQGLLIEALQVEVEALRRKEGRSSSNSSQPPSQDGPAAKAKAKADKRSAGPDQPDGQDPQDGQDPTDRVADGERKPTVEQLGPKRAQGGQRGHRGTGLQRVAPPGAVPAGGAARVCGVWWGSGRRAGPGHVQRAGVRHPHVLPGRDRLPDTAPRGA